MTLKKLVFSVLLATTAALSAPSANAWGWMPWDWFDDDYYGGPWGGPWGGPGYYGYPGYGWGGYPGYGYPAYGYPAYGFPGYGWGAYPAYGYGYPAYAYPAQPAQAQSSTNSNKQ